MIHRKRYQLLSALMQRVWCLLIDRKYGVFCFENAICWTSAVCHTFINQSWNFHYLNHSNSFICNSNYTAKKSRYKTQLSVTNYKPPAINAAIKKYDSANDWTGLSHPELSILHLSAVINQLAFTYGTASFFNKPRFNYLFRQP